ncbi:tyrosine-type recombinase/integrase [Myroides odoratimimus]|uniref:tyrosine-type recombinase/integrase n=1 Tax=Myroides odoratimimus TaxID=76832 RepID=UPI001040743D|nr:tyrosine-type recombinase/integrase [Myroides odoratimimus]MCA4791775.1 tyrosine-type recombinase/integrase [Myroides odoratimimus]MCA4805680.1 tyrosine-type recombinase/integrase [Myroides odoratimimus]MCA4819036.1 tyrosine-type recombinase/integrase [Myroides odoratimimus]MDM1059143.1 tyrosine-type recombinase/integrase [Myroides odoratimimus]MDM1091769.1 tyrosine-type recombinase/integrase [Myroides odoratimimus]
MFENLEKFIEYIQKERKYSDKTVIAYQNDIGDYVSFLEQLSLDYLKAGYDGVRLWIVKLSEEGLTNRSINRKTSALSSFYKFLLKIGEVETNPLYLHRSLKVEKKLQLPFSVKEIDTVRAMFEGKEDFNSLRDLLIVEMLYCLGLRRAELVALEVEDVDFYLHQVRVSGKGSKQRIVPLLGSVEMLLKKYLEARSLVLGSVEGIKILLVTELGKKVDEMFVYRVINSYFSNATTKEKKSPHMLRHSFATHLLEGGADINSIKELMGHESLSTTQGYAQINLSELKKVYQNSHPRGKNKEK